MPVSRRLRRWLSANTDLSMVASAFCLDPLAHFEPDRGIMLVNKTGTNAGVRADAGRVDGTRGLCRLRRDRQLGLGRPS